MHLIVLENHTTTQRGGQELNLLEICRGLFQRGHRITLLYLKPGDLLPQYASFCDRTIPISAYGFDWRSLKSILKFLPSLIQLWQIPKAKNSLIFCNDYHFSLFAYALSSFRHIPYVCYLQLPPLNLNHQRKFGLRDVDRFIAVSEQTKQDWVKFGIKSDLIHVVYNGVDLNRFQPAENYISIQQKLGITDNTKIISYIGRIDREKGLETLIKATAALIKKGKRIQTLIAGKPVTHYSFSKGHECEDEGMNYLRSLIELAETFGIRDRVKFLGHLTDPVSLYQASDVNVLPSIWNEPCSLGLFESLACGVPKVASRIGGNPEILTHEFADLLFEPGNEQDLAEKLDRILDWRTEDPSLGSRCRQHISQYFTHENMVNGIEKSLFDLTS
ncbi:group 1 glycosyl transferase [Leptolyngbya boryana NIES-2135]|jgi:glycosyltransferase involved in cell wall biosynthesis|uniref:Group 1 glycosyl transferase n=1 Tax=Leptolyngbya boryana NIES-2135 TaxID=1973484 RepID=A0A1Z4JA14_LEPBY|nr:MULTISPECIES: glycosyltransferase family 4 protein [Leptolyngbya]BAY53498.1 group 1 glycosyl transferase [Leptolyngbya boryana NIES-2135]MBD2366642.1 glycosyltransferase family 4 protein [Leptolyngbya sp. FACHB-161]MBD2373345.1 glycosyltransferase family 4 protein [Leptolyngbya sp. FACHB-238]MBD2397744.1 glycosyltransferase family 4 protein [Leptolyngbya sp. FACHB-239]MBD2407404.1 glycosyltransferase family 4 protein [Leptolyngbya sp. FACHB-402]